MILRFIPFTREHYSDYLVWFDDPALNKSLGPLDDEWLHYTLNTPINEYETWVVYRNDVMVAVVEIAYDPEGKWSPGITAIAVNPAMRRQGIATAVLENVFTMHAERGITSQQACAHVNNPVAQRMLNKVGFIVVSPNPNKHGYIEYRREA